MARKDVDLVIRAKDEAAKVVDTITRALNDFYEGTQKLDQGAEKGETALTALGKSLKTLNGILTQSDGTDKLAAGMDRAANAVNRLEAKTKEAEVALRDQERALKRQSDIVERYQSKLEGARAAQDRQKAAVSAAKAELRALSRSQKTAEADIEAATQKVQRQEAALRSIKENYATLRAQVRATGGQKTRMAKDVDRLRAALEKSKAELQRAERDLVELGQATDKADAAIQQFATGSLRQLRTEMLRQKRATVDAKAQWDLATGNVRELAAQMAATRSPSQALVQSFEAARARAALAKNEYIANRNALAQMRQAMAQAGSSTQSINAAVSRFTGSTKTLNAELDRLRGRATTAARAKRDGAVAADRQAASVSRLAQAYRQFYGDTRQSLSIMQRIRGEVLSLVAAYGGLFAAIEAIRQTINATELLAAVNARLKVAFEDSARAAQELDFIRRTADRLGVQFQSLATEYSKFAVATKGTNIEGENTRRIFVGIAEAARVNRASQQELAGVFTALTQIVSKGAVQMEELRQQLGDRLPGAVQLMADALGISTAELIKMMEQGQVTSDALVPFAEEVQRRFGAGLPDAIQSTSAALGRLQNALFDVMILFGDSGFNDGFRTFLDSLTTLLTSADFESFVARAGAAMGKFFEFLALGVENFDLLLAAISAFIAFRLSFLIGAAALAFRDFGAGILASAAALRTGAASAGTMTASITALRGALTALLSSTGIGLLVAAIGAGVAYWATQADEATEALNLHKKIVDDVKDAYDAVGGSVEKWGEALADISETELQNNIDRISNAIDGLEDQLRLTANGTEDFWTNFFGTNLRASVIRVPREMRDAIEALSRQYADGQITAQEFRDGVDEANRSLGEGRETSTEFATRVIAAARNLEEMRTALDEAEAAMDAKTGTTEEAAEAAETLKVAVEQQIDELAEAQAQADRFTTAMAAMSEGLEQVTGHLEYLEASQALAEQGRQALEAASNFGEYLDALNRIRQAQDALDDQYVSSALGGSLVDRIIGVESGGNPSARNPNSSATGLGQFIESTWLRMFKQYFPDRASGLTDAAILALRENAELSRTMTELYLRENAEQLRRAGIAITDANLYLAHFLGPGGAIDLIGSPRGTVANDVLSEGAINSNQSILDGRTREEVIAWAQRKVGISEEELAVQESMIEIERRRAEEAERAAERAQAERDRAAEATADRLAEGEFDIEQQERMNAGLEREAAIQAAIRQAKQENAAITDEELARVAEQAGRLFDLEEIERRRKDAKEAHEAAEERVNQLLQQREALERQRNVALANNDVTTANALKTEIEGVNQAMLEAIDNAIRMWQAVGGPESQVAIAQLRAAKMEAQNFGQEGQNTYLQWNRVSGMFVDGLAGAIDSWAQAVANGENAIQAAGVAFRQFAADFLLQIAQMIIKQMIFNALQAVFGGTPFGSIIGLGHTGGLVGESRVGSGNNTRSVHPALFAGARRYHTGGIAGLAPNEVPIIAKKGEEILTEDDPRHMLNGSGGSGTPQKQQDVEVRNYMDAAEFFEAGAKTDAGRRIIYNIVKGFPG
jgi:tape measure domain-containing protein